MASIEKIKFNFNNNKETSPTSTSYSPSSSNSPEQTNKISSEYGTPIGAIEKELPKNFNLNLEAKNITQYRRKLFA